MSEEEDIEARQQPKFKRDYKKLNKQGKGDPVVEGVQRIVEDPKGNSTRLKGEYEGKRKHRNDPIRIVFASCPECIERGDMKHNGCADCGDLHGEDQENHKTSSSCLRRENGRIFIKSIYWWQF